MATTFLIYWKPETVDANLRLPWLLDHSASEQFDRVEPGDQVWVATVRVGELFFLGRITVGVRGDLETAERALGRTGFWTASHHIVAANGTANAIRQIRLPGIADRLRFESPRDRLTVLDGMVNAQQLQTMRILTPESARELEAEFDLAQ
jgi:hypothetical protein